MARPSLRIVVFILAGLTVAKVWTQNRYTRAIFDETLIQAYEEKAIASCQKEASRIAHARAPLRLVDPEVTIGSPFSDVAIWDYDNPLWEVRFRHPHLVLKADGSGETRCAFDVMAGLANISGGVTR